MTNLHQAITRFASSSRALIAIRIIGTGLSFIVTIILSRYLGAEDFGQYAMILMVISLLEIPLGRGWSTLILRAISQKANKNRWLESSSLIREGHRLSAAYGLVLLIIGLILTQIKDLEIAWFIPLIIGGLVITRQNSAFRLSLIRGHGYPAATQLPELILQPVLIAILFLAVIFLQKTTINWTLALFILFLSSLIILLASMVIQKFLLPYTFSETQVYKKNNFKKHILSASIIGINGMLTTLFTQIDSYILAFSVDTASLGIYKIAIQFSTIGGFMYAALNFLAAAQMNEAWSLGNLGAVEKISARFGLYSLVFVGCFYFFIFSFGESIIDFFLGNEYSAAYPLILILLLGQVINSSVGMPAVLLIMTGNENHVIRHTIAGLVVVAAFSIILIPLIGIDGAAWASVLGVTLLNISYYLTARKVLGVNLAVWRNIF